MIVSNEFEINTLHAEEFPYATWFSKSRFADAKARIIIEYVVLAQDKEDIMLGFKSKEDLELAIQIIEGD